MSEDSTATLVAKLIAVVTLTFGSLAAGVWTLVNAYGLHIVSWGTLIIGSVLQIVLLGLVSAMKEKS